MRALDYFRFVERPSLTAVEASRRITGMRYLAASLAAIVLVSAGQVAAQDRPSSEPAGIPCAQFKMRVVPPTAGVDYKLRVRTPPEGVDYKMRVVNPCKEMGLLALVQPPPGEGKSRAGYFRLPAPRFGYGPDEKGGAASGVMAPRLYKPPPFEKQQ
jgi:hypothetical protein